MRLALLLLLLVYASSACGQTTRKPQVRPWLPNGAKPARNLAYVEKGHARQVMDLFYAPEGPRRPVVVWIHGGAWLSGDKSANPALRLLQTGYAVAGINYRLSHHRTYPAQLEDCKAAIRFLRDKADEYNLDPDRIAVWGASAGGHLASLVGVTGDTADFDGKNPPRISSAVQAVVSFYAPTDFTKMTEQSGPDSRIDHDAPNSPESRLLGAPARKNPKLAAKANPITYISKSDPPFLLVHGDDDQVVPLGQSEIFYSALQEAGVDSSLHIVRDAGHGDRGFRTPELFQMVKSFLDEKLRHKSPD